MSKPTGAPPPEPGSFYDWLEGGETDCERFEREQAAAPQKAFGTRNIVSECNNFTNRARNGLQWIHKDN